jgi:hypothetical protein
MLASESSSALVVCTRISSLFGHALCVVEMVEHELRQAESFEIAGRRHDRKLALFGQVLSQALGADQNTVYCTIILRSETASESASKCLEPDDSSSVVVRRVLELPQGHLSLVSS